EARLYDGELPFKLVIFDREVVFSTLVRRSGHPAALFVKHAPYARGMSILFEFFWNQSKPLVIEEQRVTTAASKASAKSAPKADQASQRISHNGRLGRSAKK